MLLVFSVKVTRRLIIFNTLKKYTGSSLVVDQSNNKMVSYLLWYGLREWIYKFWARKWQK